MPARELLTRLIPAAAIVASLLVTPVADGRSPGHQRPTGARLAADCPNTTVIPTAANLAEVRAAILCLHNQVRAAAGLPRLKANAKLARSAAGHSADMVAAGYFEHTAPSGATFVDRILRARYVRRGDGWTLGENLAWGTSDLSTPAGLMHAWMSSPGHKANIVKRAYREVGIGIRLGVPSDAGVGATVTLDFGAKR